MIKDLKGKKQVSETQMAQIEQFVARHLGKVKRLFDDGQLKPDQYELMCWRCLREHRNVDTIQRGEWMNGAKSSGALRSPGKRFLETAAECNRLVNERDKVNWAKTSMPLCGLDVGSNGKWESVQLSKELQGIVARYSEDSSEGYNETGHSGSV
ncbi:hypothetical protein PHPALM_29042 [Phytophthora palmivora]|uniref:Uncharacterized protein n=1 Tax=Phytophthora palmivora TaxID=4796 RepID=A0A2P4X8J7_9STRA|nr:hypothetical protein PHPALM_29042 [Phytophthora palmivora]